MITIKFCTANEIPSEEVLQIKQMIYANWPPRTDEQQADLVSDTFIPFSNEDERHILAYDGDKLIGYGVIFLRVISDKKKTYRNLGLANLNLLPDYQGQGIGTKIVKKIFKEIDDGHYDCSIFQTGEQRFYDRLNCRVMDELFIDTVDNTNPVWWHEAVMVYPADITFHGMIDLKGMGY